MSSWAQIPHFTKVDIAKILNTNLSVIKQDHRGFMWLGTEAGLYRYDGNDFNLMSNGSDSLAQFSITALYCDSSQIWYGCKDGSIYYLAQDQINHPYKPQEGLPSVPISGIVKDSQGRLWYSTYGEGVYVQTNDHVYNLNIEDGLLENQIYQMTIDPQDRIWVATDNGVSICQFTEGKKHIRNITRADGLPDEIVYSLCPSLTGMWLGFESNGFCHYSTADDSVDFQVENWQYGSVRTICQVVGNSLWIGTEDHGVLDCEFMHDGSLEMMRQIEETQMQECELIYYDQAGNIWFLLDQHLLFSGVGTLDILHHDLGDIQAVCQSPDDQVWVGTRKGLYVLHDGKLKYQQFPNENIISLYSDNNGKIWIGTFGNGIICWDPKTKRSLSLTEKEGLVNGSVFSIDGREDRLWLATLGGIIEVSNSKGILNGTRIPFKNLIAHTELSSNFFYKVYVDQDGKVWFGTDGQGVLNLTDDKVTNLLSEGLLPAKTVYCITEDDSGDFWFGTNGEGVFKYDGESWQHLGLEDGLSSQTITSIANDQSGHLIMIHEDGIDVYDPKNGTFRYFDENTGLDHLNPGLNVISAFDKESIWIGGQNSLIHYISDENMVQTYPSVIIDQIRLINEPIDYATKRKFSSHENFIEFDYVGIWYAAPQSVRYEYQLEGYDLDWKITRDQSISYSRLIPGDYTFRVRSVMNDQPILPTEQTYSFTINLPFWKRGWFLALMTLCAGGAFYGYQRYREQLISKRESIDRERIESQYEVLKAQINPHFLFNSFNTLAGIVEEDPDLAVEYIEKLSDYYRSIIQFRDLKLIPLDDELVLIDDFTFLLKKRFGKNLLVRKFIDETDYYIPPLTIQMLVENAVKHNIISRQKPLTISIRSENDEYLVVENNLQPKKTQEPSTRFGLQNIKTRFEILTKKKVVIEENDQSFSVSIPLIKRKDIK